MIKVSKIPQITNEPSKLTLTSSVFKSIIKNNKTKETRETPINRNIKFTLIVYGVFPIDEVRLFGRNITLNLGDAGYILHFWETLYDNLVSHFLCKIIGKKID